jgi:hypothetical protein
VQQGRERFGWRTLADLLADGQPPQPRVVLPLPRRTAAGRGRPGTTSVNAPAAGDGGPAGAPAPRRRRRRGGRRHRRDEGTPRTPGGEAGTEPV